MSVTQSASLFVGEDDQHWLGWMGLPEDESDHRHHGSRSPVHQATGKPCRRLGKGLYEPFVKHGRESRTVSVSILVHREKTEYDIHGQNLVPEQFRSLFLWHLFDLSENVAHLGRLSCAVSAAYTLFRGRSTTHPALDSSCFVVPHQHGTNGNGVWNPLYEATFLVERHHAIRADI